jgi:hypothetical protein
MHKNQTIHFVDTVHDDYRPFQIMLPSKNKVNAD